MDAPSQRGPAGRRRLPIPTKEAIALALLVLQAVVRMWYRRKMVVSARVFRMNQRLESELERDRRPTTLLPGYSARPGRQDRAKAKRR
jgi:hypothetical protein